MRMRYAMVCSSNQNRSMEAHVLLRREGFDVASYGTGNNVKLPGPSLREPNVYEFGTPYRQMFDDLPRKYPELYKRNGILPMLKRNYSVKTAPQRWQDNASDVVFDVVLTLKVFDIVLEDLHTRDQSLMKPVLVINLEVKDNHEEAATGAQLALDLCREIYLLMPTILALLLWHTRGLVNNEYHFTLPFCYAIYADLSIMSVISRFLNRLMLSSSGKIY